MDATVVTGWDALLSSAGGLLNQLSHSNLSRCRAASTGAVTSLPFPVPMREPHAPARRHKSRWLDEGNGAEPCRIRHGPAPAYDETE